MAVSTEADSTLVHRANLNIASAIMAKSGPNVPDSLIGHAIDRIRASHPVAELAESGNMPMVVSAVETFLARHQEADRPRNLYGAEAAQAGQALGGADGLRGGGVGGLDLGRAASSARYREVSGDESGGSGSGGSNAASRGTGSEPAGAAFWGTAKGMLITRAYANDNAMGWAPTDLMKMGRPALQALKESGLKGDGYKALRQPSGLNFDNDTIVHGAGFMKRNHLNYDEAGKAAGKLYQHPSLKDADRKEVKGATEQAAKANNKAEDEAAKARIGRAQTRIRKDCPEAAKEVDDWAKKYGADKGAGLDAKAKATKDNAEAQHKDAKASHQQEQAKSRRAAAQNSFGSL